MSRATRLAELQDQIAKDAGYDSIAGMTGADRQRCEQSALLKLQFECCAAKLVSGGELITTELLALNAALNDTFPAAKAKPLVISFVDDFSYQLSRAIDSCGPDDDVAKAALQLANERLVELEAQLKSSRAAVESAEREVKRLQAEQRPSLELVNVQPSLSQRTPSGKVSAPGCTAISPESGAWQAFADLNAGFGPQCPAAARGREYRFEPDVFDKFGKRIKQT
jgi:hypothetical protein